MPPAPGPHDPALPQRPRSGGLQRLRQGRVHHPSARAVVHRAVSGAGGTRCAPGRQRIRSMPTASRPAWRVGRLANHACRPKQRCSRSAAVRGRHRSVFSRPLPHFVPRVSISSPSWQRSQPSQLRHSTRSSSFPTSAAPCPTGSLAEHVDWEDLGLQERPTGMQGPQLVFEKPDSSDVGDMLMY